MQEYFADEKKKFLTSLLGMSSLTEYTFNRVVRDPKQLDLFLLSHMGDPFLYSETDSVGGVTHVYTNEPERTTSTQEALAHQLSRYPDPPRTAAGPVSTVIVKVANGGTGRSGIPTGSIVFGTNEEPLSVDPSLSFNPVTKTLGVLSVS